MAKAPVPGRAKTRLCPPLTFAEAAAVAEAALADTLTAVASCAAEHKLIALDGAAGPWLPEGFRIVPQIGGRLDERLAHAWAATGGLTGRRGVQIGMDTPQVTAAELDRMLEQLVGKGADRRRSALLGPATDGGWWAIGLSGTDPYRVFAGIPMSKPDTNAAQLARLHALDLDVRVVHEHRDVDTFADLEAVAIAAPHTATAAVLRGRERAAAKAS